MPDFTVTAKTTGASIKVPVQLNDSFYIYEIEQITVQYTGGANDAPNGAILKNGVAYGGAAPLMPGIVGNTLSQTWAGDPHLWMEVTDDVEVQLVNCTAGATVVVFAQYLRYRANDPDVQERKSTG